MTKITDPMFTDEAEARKVVEGIRWPTGPVCGHCGETERRYATKREGRYRCGNPVCRKDFSVTTGTVMESSHVKLNKWLLGFYLVSSSKKGMSAHQLHRMLGVTYKTAWFMHHRIREAMRAGGLLPPMGGNGQPVEADETYFGEVEAPKSTKTDGTPYLKGGKKAANKRVIVSLVERGGNVRSFHIPRADKHNVMQIVTDNLAREATLYTDESRLYLTAQTHVAKHESVHHASKEYARGPVHTNTVEGFFSIFKRGMRGVYQHCSEKHLHRYLAEFDFRYNGRYITDGERAALAVKGAEGKRLTYRQPH